MVSLVVCDGVRLKNRRAKWTVFVFLCSPACAHNSLSIYKPCFEFSSSDGKYFGRLELSTISKNLDHKNVKKELDLFISTASIFFGSLNCCSDFGGGGITSDFSR